MGDKLVDGIMERRRRDRNYPVIRDWQDIDCLAVSCKYNKVKKCMVPSLCKIGDDGHCTGFEIKILKFDRTPIDGD